MTPRQLRSARAKVAHIIGKLQFSISRGALGSATAVRDQDLLIGELDEALTLLKAYRNSAASLEAVRTRDES